MEINNKAMRVKDILIDRLKEIYWMQPFLFAFLAASLGIVPHLILGNGSLMLSNDYAALFIPKNMLMANTFKTGNLLWNWNIDLGGNYLESFGIGSIFSLILTLFPAKSIPYVMGWMVILKIAVAAQIASLYFRRHFNKNSTVVICSLLYAFSGYQIVNIIFYIFLDFTAFFPLMLLGVELLVEERKRGVLLVAVVLNLSCSLTIFYGEVLFLVLYYIVKYFKLETFRSKQAFSCQLRNILNCFIEGILGMACVAITVLPSFANLQSNSRISDHLSTSSWFTVTTKNWLQTLRAYLLPAEPMNHAASIDLSNWYSNAIYLPVVGMIFVFAYLWKKHDWKSKLVKICMVISVVPLFSSAFMAFSYEPYRRWYFMLTIILVLVSGCVLDNYKDYPVLKSFVVNIGLIIIYFLMTAVFQWDSKIENLVLIKKAYYFSMVIAIAGLLLCIIHLGFEIKSYSHIILTAVIIFSSGMLFLHVRQCQSVDNSSIDFKEYKNSYYENMIAYLTETTEDLEQDILPYRYYFDENIKYTYYNLSMTNSLPSINSFLSTPHSSIFEFYDSLGIGRHTMTRAVGNGGKELLGAKYIVSVVERPEYKLLYSKTLSSGMVIYYYENENALPIGFTYDSYITKSEFELLDSAYRPVAMLNALVVADDDEMTVSQSIPHTDNSNYEELLRNLQTVIDDRRTESTITFDTKNNYFSSTVETNGEKYMFFSVPYDKSWSAKVNDENADILNINGLMAVRVPAGESTICFQYNYPLIKYAIAISVIGVLLSAFYIVLYIAKKVGE